jgi:hypothetical protein
MPTTPEGYCVLAYPEGLFGQRRADFNQPQDQYWSRVLILAQSNLNRDAKMMYDIRFRRKTALLLGVSAYLLVQSDALRGAQS